jgi:hypothetical protein
LSNDNPVPPGMGTPPRTPRRIPEDWAVELGRRVNAHPPGAEPHSEFGMHGWRVPRKGLGIDARWAGHWTPRS